jgi:glycosidase
VDSWPKHPMLYEINTWVWLEELGRKHDSRMTLASVPDEEWDAMGSLGFDAVWLMGVWERSPAGVRVAMENPGLLADFQGVLPDLSAADVVGSPYCVRRYVADGRLGGTGGLAAARAQLARRGMRLILDFVPNHLAPDHPWVAEHPDYFIRGDAGDFERDPTSFYEAGGEVFACGRDPHFPAWSDVLQLNAFDDGQRAAMVETVLSIAEQCDGARCDMAMLVMNDVFQRTWSRRAGARPSAEYWPPLIAAVRQSKRGFLFMAEAYWDLERELQQQGFDYCYDKRLYDRLEKGPAESVRGHLQADLGHQERLVRFIENHDERRAAAVFPNKGRAAAVAVATLPGARLFYEGQLEGRRIRLPMFLGRRPPEPGDEELQAFYRRLLAEAASPLLRNGEWRLLEVTGWPDKQGCRNLVAWCWSQGGDRRLVVVNLADAPAQGRVPIPWPELAGQRWQLRDLPPGTVYERDGGELVRDGLYVDLPPGGYHVLQLSKGGAASHPP